MDPFRAPVEKKVQSKSVEHWKRLTARVYAETLHELCIQIEIRTTMQTSSAKTSVWHWSSVAMTNEIETHRNPHTKQS